MKNIKQWSKFIESSYYEEIDGINITKIKRDNQHYYPSLNGIIYEKSDNGNEEIINVDEIEHTEENTFYDNQIKNYVNYIKQGGIIQTFPVDEYKEFNNLQEMLEHLEEDFDMMYDLLRVNHREVFDMNLSDVYIDPEEYGIEIDLELVKTFKMLEDNFNRDEGNEKVFNALKDIMNHMSNIKSYTLKDFNHRFAAVKEMGVKSVWVDIMNK